MSAAFCGGGFPIRFCFLAAREGGFSGRGVPEVKEKIENGALSLSMASRLQTFFRQEEKLTEVSEEKKKEMIESVQGLSTFEAERTLLRNSIEPVRHTPEKVRVVSETALQVQFTVTREQMAQIAKQKLDPTERKCRTVYPQRRNTQGPRRESRVASAALRAFGVKKIVKESGCLG